jgi:hypothetical protein
METMNKYILVRHPAQFGPVKDLQSLYPGMSTSELTKMNNDWPCTYEARTIHPNGKPIYLRSCFNGFGDPVSNLEKLLQKRIKKPWLWFGVELLILTPAQQLIICVIEELEGKIILEAIK